MISPTVMIIATFTRPEQIGTTPLALMWLLPLTLAVAVVYKATKLSHITFVAFVKESLTLFASIIAFIAITALVLHVVAWVIGL